MVKQLADILLERGLVDEAQLAAAYDEHQRAGRSLGRVLVDQGVLTEAQLVEALASQIGLQFVDLAECNVDGSAVARVSPAVCRRHTVLPIGYADGLPRRASGRAEVAIRGRRVPLVGLISMDIAIADVTDVPGVAVGDAAVLLGRAGAGTSISVAEYAAWAGLTEYEVTCGMSKRVPRTYVGDPP